MRLFLALCWAFLALVRPAGAQDAVGDRVEPGIEENLRDQLRKLERWGLQQLLSAERQVDREQKRRARTSANHEELALLARDEDGGVRFFVATNRHAPTPLLAQLANDAAVHVRSGVAMALGHTTDAFEYRRPVEGLAATLSRDDQVLVRLMLAQNTGLGAQAYDSLALDPDFVVRLKLAQNPRITATALATLAGDVMPEVQIAALGHRAAPASLLGQHVGAGDALVRQAVAANPNASLAVINALSGDEDPGVRALVAEHPNADETLLDELLADTDPAVLTALARNPRASRAQLMHLAAMDDMDVRQAAEKHLEPLLRSEIREDILERWFTPQ